jgi:hypothetical protein
VPAEEAIGHTTARRGLFDFQSESGALTFMQVGRLALRRKQQSKDRQKRLRSDLNVACEGGETNFGLEKIAVRY